MINGQSPSQFIAMYWGFDISPRSPKNQAFITQFRYCVITSNIPRLSVSVRRNAMSIPHGRHKMIKAYPKEVSCVNRNDNCKRKI